MLIIGYQSSNIPMLILKGEMVKCTPQRPYHTSCGRDATKNFGLFVSFLDNIDFSRETLVVVLGHFAHFHLFNITGIKSLQVFGTGNDAIDFNSGLLAFTCQGVAVVEGYHARQKGKCLVSLCRFKKPSGVNSIYRFLCIVFAYGAVSNHFHLFDFLHFVAQDQPDNADGIRSVNRYYGIKVLIEFTFYRHCYVVTSSLLRGIADYSHSLGISLHPLGNSTII